MPTDNQTTAAPVEPAPPDLRQYRAMHSAIRTSNERLVVGLTDLRRSARHPAAIALQKWFRGYREELRGHHRIEDTIFFPALAARIPSYADYSPTLDADHHRLDELVDLVSESLEALASAGSTWDHDHAIAVARAVELRDLMAEHLDFEDREILPMFERHFSTEEYAALDAQARRTVSMKHAVFFVPWFMTSVDASVAAAALADAPIPLKVIHRLTRRSYRRLVAEAFGTAALDEAGDQR
jgi:hypothetical protein